MTGYIMFI